MSPRHWRCGRIYDRRPRKTLAAIGDKIEALLPGAVKILGACTSSPAVSGCSDPTAQSFLELHGQIDLPIFQTAFKPRAKQARRSHISIAAAPLLWMPAARLQSQGTESVSFALTIPNGLVGSATPIPLVITPTASMRTIARALRAAGRDPVFRHCHRRAVTGPARFAVLSIEQVAHGDRRCASVLPAADIFFNLLNLDALKERPAGRCRPIVRS